MKQCAISFLLFSFFKSSLLCLQDLYVKADMWWKSVGVHRSDILAVSQCAALGVIATASHNGDLVVWRLETQGAVQHLHPSG